MINDDIFIILIYELVFHTTPGFAAWPAPTFKCRYLTACCNSVQNIPPQFLSLLSLQQFWSEKFQTMTQRNSDFSRSDARCFKSSAWFSRGHIFHTCASHISRRLRPGPCSKTIETYIRKLLFSHIVTMRHMFSHCTHVLHMFILYNPIPIYFNVFSFFQIYPDSQFWFRAFLDLIIEYFNILAYPYKTEVFGHRSFQTMIQKECDFSRSDARCFKSSAWFSRGHNFPYMCLPHF